MPQVQHILFFAPLKRWKALLNHKFFGVLEQLSRFHSQLRHLCVEFATTQHLALWRCLLLDCSATSCKGAILHHPSICKDRDNFIYFVFNVIGIINEIGNRFSAHPLLHYAEFNRAYCTTDNVGRNEYRKVAEFPQFFDCYIFVNHNLISPYFLINFRAWIVKSMVWSIQHWLHLVCGLKGMRHFCDNSAIVVLSASVKERFLALLDNADICSRVIMLQE